MPVIDHIQKTQISVGTGDSSKTWTFGTPLDDITRCLLMFTVKGNDADEDRLNKGAFRAVLDGTTTATFLHDTAGKAYTIEATVIQFSTGEATVQRGTNTDTTDPIDQVLGTAVDLSLAVPLWSFYTDLAQGPGENFTPELLLTSTTNLRFDFAGAPGASDFRYSYQVLQWAGADVSMQTSTHTLAALDDSDVVSITDITDTAKGLLFFSYRMSTGTSSWARGALRGRITSSTQLTFDRQDGGSGNALTISYFVVKFLDDTTVDAVNVNVADTATSNTGTVSLADTANCALFSDSFTHHWRFVGTEGNANDWDVQMACVITNTTTVTASRTGDDGGVDVWIQVVEFPTAGGGGGGGGFRSRVAGGFVLN